jgi:hypothetical protein
MWMPPALAAVAIALAVPGLGVAGDDENGDHDQDSVTRVACIGGTAELRLEADYDEDDDDDDDERGREIEIELRVDVRRPVAQWRLVLLHERRLVYYGVRRSVRDGYALRYRREVPDWDGSQTVAARLSTTTGHTCRLEATI